MHYGRVHHLFAHIIMIFHSVLDNAYLRVHRYGVIMPEITDFQTTEEGRQYERDIMLVLQGEKKDYPSYFGGMKVASGNEFPVFSPIDPSIRFGIFQEPEEGIMVEAVSAAVKAFETWSKVPVDERVKYFEMALKVFQARRSYYAAAVTVSTGMVREDALQEVDRLIEVVTKAIEDVKALGVKIETNVIAGRTVTIDYLMDKEGFAAVFIGSGAGLPRFMNIPGEHFNGVFSANEFLTRNNLMKAYRDDYDTPIHAGKKVVVVGGGNVAMDAARTALRLGAETTIVYRRTENELPARKEEVHHAKEEGIKFAMLTNPVEVIGDENGWVKAIKCIRMELGEPDESGRRSPVEVPGSEFEIETETVIMSLGTSPNPLIAKTTEGLETNRKGCIVADENGATSRPGVFAGGDAVTGAATVILAMGAGRKAAAAINEYLKK